MINELAVVFNALGDPTRLKMVYELSHTNGERPMGSLGLSVTKSTRTHHFRVLEDAGLINIRADGTRRMVSLRSGVDRWLYTSTAWVMRGSR